MAGLTKGRVYYLLHFLHIRPRNGVHFRNGREIFKFKCQTCNYNAGSVADLPLAVAREAGIIADVVVLDGRYPQLRAVVHYVDRFGRLDWIRVFVPQHFRRRRTLRLAIEDYRVAQIHVDHLLWGYRESRRGCWQLVEIRSIASCRSTRGYIQFVRFETRAYRARPSGTRCRFCCCLEIC